LYLFQSPNFVFLKLGKLYSLLVLNYIFSKPLYQQQISS
jgi:hypothetical protein